MAIHLLHKGGPGPGASATYARKHFPQLLPTKSEFMDANAAKDGRNTRWLNFTGVPNDRNWEFKFTDGQALAQYMREYPIVEGDIIVTHIVPMHFRLDAVDIEITKPLAGAQVTLSIHEIDDNGPTAGPLVLDLITGLDLSTGISEATETDGYEYVDAYAVNGNVPFVTRRNHILVMKLDTLPNDDISGLHVKITPMMDYVHQVEH